MRQYRLMSLALGVAVLATTFAGPVTAEGPVAANGPVAADGTTGAERPMAAKPGVTTADSRLDDTALVDVIVRVEPNATAATAADTAENNTDGQVLSVFDEAINGYALRLPADQVAELRNDPEVRSVRLDTPVYQADVQLPAPPNLDRIDDQSLPLDGDYEYSSQSTGAGVTVYVVDSGVRIGHSQFGARARYGYDVLDDDQVAEDCSGHGTHVAGTVAGTKYGAAKLAEIAAVRVFDCDSSGSAYTVIAGIDWILANRPAGELSVINASVTGPPNPDLDAAFAAAVDAGITVVVAAGNNNFDACGLSPGRVPSVITVGAVDADDRRAPFSNFGPCVDIWAPGVDVVSAGRTSNNATTVMSGTSMAAPLVSAAVARYLQNRPTATPADMDRWLKSGASGEILDARSACDKVLSIPMSTAGPRTMKPAVLSVQKSGSACAVYGPNSGGTTLALTGANFTSASKVTVAGAPAAFTVNSATSMTVTTPAVAAVGRQSIRVTGPAGTSSANPTARFNYYFRDVPPSAEIFGDVLRLAGDGVIRGHADGTFRPKDSVDRGSLAVFLYRATHPGSPDPVCRAGRRTFSDVPRTFAQCGAIEWLAAAGITTGFNGDKFRPSVVVTRGPVSAMLLRLLNPGQPDPGCRGSARMFADVAKTTQFCGSIEYLADLNVTAGYSDGSFRPSVRVSRGAFAVLLNKVIDLAE